MDAHYSQYLITYACPVKSEAYFTGAKAIQLGPDPIHEDMKVKLQITYLPNNVPYYLAS